MQEGRRVVQDGVESSAGAIGGKKSGEDELRCQDQGIKGEWRWMKCWWNWRGVGVRIASGPMVGDQSRNGCIRGWEVEDWGQDIGRRQIAGTGHRRNSKGGAVRAPHRGDTKSEQVRPDGSNHDG